MPQRVRQTSLEESDVGSRRRGVLVGHPWIRLVADGEQPAATTISTRTETDRAA